jgi:hypothetical protein
MSLTVHWGTNRSSLPLVVPEAAEQGQQLSVEFLEKLGGDDDGLCRFHFESLEFGGGGSKFFWVGTFAELRMKQLFCDLLGDWFHLVRGRARQRLYFCVADRATYEFCPQ